MHLLVDTDPGMGTLNSDPEDSFAITLASNSPEAELAGVTVVQGNVPLRHGYGNARHLLELLGLDGRVELAAGAAGSLLGGASRREQGRWLTEKNSWERLVDAVDAPYPGRSAVELIRAAAEEHDDLVIAAVGPLTNIALALRLYPHLVGRIRRLVVMGGVFMERGNVTPTAEFNFYMDPEAAQAVLDSGITPELIGLDVCHRTHLTQQQIDEHATGSAFGDFVKESCADWLGAMQSQGLAGLHLFDSLAVASALQPDIVKLEPAWVEIVQGDSPAAGTSLSWYGDRAEWSRPSPEVNALIAVDFDESRFTRLFEERVLTLL